MAGSILVTGRTGQLAAALADTASAHGLTLQCLERPVLDIERPASIAQVFSAHAPSLVINAAAYTNVDAAEDDSAVAYRANRDGPAELARLCAAACIPLIHMSTDYVFDGRKGAPYVESDITAPQGVYGASKLAGEQAVLTFCPRTIVLRTSWLYSPTGKNFVRTMLAAGERNDNLRVVADQIGCPTSAQDLRGSSLVSQGNYATVGTIAAPASTTRPARAPLHGMNWPPPPSQQQCGMAAGRPTSSRSRHRSGPPGLCARLTRGSIAAGLRRCSDCDCRHGRTASRKR